MISERGSKDFRNEQRDKEREIKRGMDETKKRFYGSNRKFDPSALIRL